MPSIKDNIKSKLLDMIAEEQQNCIVRQAMCETAQEEYQITAERNFLNKLEVFGKSL